LSDESFFPHANWLNSFRFRATYGASGVQPSTTAAARFLSSVTAAVSSGVDQPGVQLGALGNPNLKPEYSGEFETGFDMSLFSSRTTFEFTYYNKKTKDAIISRPLAPSIAGITSFFDNLGSIRNQGMEVTFNNRLIDRREVGFDVQVTGSTNKNRILGLGEGVTPVFTGNRSTQYNAPGYPLFGLWGKTITYNDKNGDHYLAVNEVCQDVGGCRAADTAIYMGPSSPTMEFAVNPRIELFNRKLSISAQVDHKQGNLKFNNTLRHQCQGGLSARASGTRPRRCTHRLAPSRSTIIRSTPGCTRTAGSRVCAKSHSRIRCLTGSRPRLERPARRSSSQDATSMFGRLTPASTRRPRSEMVTNAATRSISRRHHFAT
jgi:hypothetical protein